MASQQLAKRWLAALLVVTLACGCAPQQQPRTQFRKARVTQFGNIAGPTAEQTQWMSDLCPEGIPKDVGGDFGNTTLVIRKGYVLEHSAADKIPLWVCEHVTKAAVDGPLNRPKPEPFKPDPVLQGQRRAELSDYKKSGYDRGHQSPSADQTVDQTLQNETYFLSNMAPQWPNLNQRIWARLEDKVRELARQRNDVYVITGPMFYDPAEDDPHTADGYIDYQTIGDGVAVPTHCYKIIAWKDDQGQWQGTALVIENVKKAYPTPYHFNDFTRSIKWIEAQTGLNFMPDLPGPDALRVEGKPSDPKGNPVPWQD